MAFLMPSLFLFSCSEEKSELENPPYESLQEESQKEDYKDTPSEIDHSILEQLKQSISNRILRISDDIDFEYKPSFERHSKKNTEAFEKEFECLTKLENKSAYAKVLLPWSQDTTQTKGWTDKRRKWVCIELQKLINEDSNIAVAEDAIKQSEEAKNTANNAIEKAQKASEIAEDNKNKIDAIKQNIEDAKSELDKKIEVKIGWTEALISATIALIIAIIFTLIIAKNKTPHNIKNETPDNNQQIKQLKDEIENLKKQFQSSKTSQSNINLGKDTSDYKPEPIEKDTDKTTTPQHVPQKQAPITQTTPNERECEYLGDFEGNTLYKNSKTSDSNCYFKVYWKDANKIEGEIEIFDLERIKPQDHIQAQMIESEGASYSRANSYHLKKKGLVKKRNNGEGWEVVEKVEIILISFS